MTRLAALGGAVIISFSAIFYALAEVDPVSATFWRMAYAIPVLFAIWWFRRSEDGRSMKRRGLAFLSGVLVAFDLIAWQTSIDYIGVGLGTLIANLQVIIVGLIAWAVLGEEPSRVLKFAIPVVLVGVAMVSGVGQNDAYGDDPLLGTLFAMAAALLYAGFLLLYRQSNRSKAPAAGPLLEASLGAIVTTALIALVGPGMDLNVRWPNHGWLLALALGGFLTGWILITYALPRLQAVETSTFVLVQPALTMIWGAWLFTERPSQLQALGAAIVLAGVAVVAVSQSRAEPRQQPEPALEAG